VLPDGLAARLDATRWTRPAVFDWLQRTGNIAPTEMTRTFNCGIGMIIAVAPDRAAAILQALPAAVAIGEVVESKGNTAVEVIGYPS
jgi:phosphoribosylformylglycinamidine cyclo-ligase